MTDDEKKILEAERCNLSPVAQELMRRLLEELDRMKYMLSKIQDLPGEKWRDVVGYEGLYQVSNMGRLKSLHYEKSVILNPRTASDGYINVTLTRNGEKKYFRLHILVAQAFIPNPDNLPVVHHDDDNKANCRADNLHWTTHSENTKLAYESGAAKSGCKHHYAKFTSEQVKEIRESYIPYDSEFGARALARKLNVNIKTIYKIINGTSYKDVT